MIYGVFQQRSRRITDFWLSPLEQGLAFGALSISWRATATTTPARMLMCGKEALTKQDKTRTASPATIPYSRGKIAEQATAVKDERRILRRPMTAAARPAFAAIKGATD